MLIHDRVLTLLSILLLGTALLLAILNVGYKWYVRRREQRTAELMAFLNVLYESNWQEETALLQRERLLAERLLLERLQERDPRAITRFVSLGYMGDYLRLTTSKRAEDRARVAHSLGCLPPELEPEELLLPLLSDPHKVVREAAIRSAAIVGSASSAERLLKVMQRSSDSRLFGVVRDALTHQGQMALPATVAALGSTAPAIRYLALDVLSGIGAPEVEGAVLPLAQDPDLEVRLRVARVLRSCSSPTAAAALMELSVDPEWQVRAQAAKALSWISGEQVIGRLQQMATDHSYWVRNNAVQSLRFKGEAGLAALQALAAGSDRYAAERAQESLDLLEREERLV